MYPHIWLWETLNFVSLPRVTCAKIRIALLDLRILCGLLQAFKPECILVFKRVQVQTNANHPFFYFVLLNYGSVILTL